jgi:uncharacterized protein YciI
METQPRQQHYLILQRAAADPDAVHPLMDSHLAWLAAGLEAETLVLTGIGHTEGAEKPDAGFLIVRADSFAEAHALAQSDPFIREAARSYEIVRLTPMNGLLRISFWGGAGTLS